MERYVMINKLTLRDAGDYRLRKLKDTGIMQKEPVGFRSKLYAIYDNLSDEQLIELLKLKEI